MDETDPTKKSARPQVEFGAASRPLRSAIGSVCLFVGIVLLGLLAVDRACGLPFEMPRSWYSDRSLWVAIGLAALGGSWFLLRDRENEADRVPPSRFSELVLYTRRGCHLCDLARETLEKYRDVLPPPIEVNIDASPVLRAQFTDCVPVVRIDGKVRFRGRVNEVLLRRLIEGTNGRLP